jgi:hypothetical protein
MTDTSPALSLPYIQPSQAQKHVTHNEALRMLDAVTQLSVQSSTLTQAPAVPVSGDRYLVGFGATGDWAGQDRKSRSITALAGPFSNPVMAGAQM